MRVFVAGVIINGMMLPTEYDNLKGAVAMYKSRLLIDEPAKVKLIDNRISPKWQMAGFSNIHYLTDIIWEEHDEMYRVTHFVIELEKGSHNIVLPENQPLEVMIRKLKRIDRK